MLFGIGTYTINANFLVRKFYTDDGTCYKEERYRYEFGKDQLKLTKDPVYIPNSDGNSPYIYIVNIYVFKRIK